VKRNGKLPSRDRQKLIDLAGDQRVLAEKPLVLPEGKQGRDLERGIHHGKRLVRDDDHVAPVDGAGCRERPAHVVRGGTDYVMAPPPGPGVRLGQLRRERIRRGVGTSQVAGGTLLGVMPSGTDERGGMLLLEEREQVEVRRDADAFLPYPP